MNLTKPTSKKWTIFLAAVCTALTIQARAQDQDAELKFEAHPVGVDAVPPQPLALGEPFTRTYVLPRKAVFWKQGIKSDENGDPVGKGTLSVELVLLACTYC